MNTTSILCLLDVASGTVTELKRFDHLMEAPFFENADTLMYNQEGRVYRYFLSDGSIAKVDTAYCVRCNNDHVLSPDGKTLAVSHATKEDLQSRIYLIDLTGANPPRLVTPLAPSYLHGYSPDGRTLAYCASRGGEYDVYTIPAIGGEETRLTDTKGLNDGPEYSADGKWIYFNSVRCGNMECFRMKPDGSAPERLTNNRRHNWFPHIAPDCKTAAYISYDPAEAEAGDHPANKHVEIHLMDADGGNDRVAVKFFGGQGSFNVNSWSPDSRTFAFVQYEGR